MTAVTILAIRTTVQQLGLGVVIVGDEYGARFETTMPARTARSTTITAAQWPRRCRGTEC